jgi:hypothetical protein
VWRLLKAEIVYNWQVFLFILLTSLLGFFGIHFWPVVFRPAPANMNTGFVYLSLMYSYFVMAVLVTLWAKEKRCRHLMNLPVSVRQINTAHGLLHAGYWIFIVALFFLWSRISAYFLLDLSVLRALGVLTGMSFLAYALVSFASRFQESVAKGAIQIIAILLIGTVAAAGIVHNYQGRGDYHFIDNFLSWIFQSPVSTLVWMVVGIGSAAIVLSLPRSKSYA